MINQVYFPSCHPREYRDLSMTLNADPAMKAGSTDSTMRAQRSTWTEMNINAVVSVPMIAFSLFALVLEALGCQLIFERSDILFVRSETAFDRTRVQAMLFSGVVSYGIGFS